MKPHESPRIRKKSIRGNSGDSWPVWNRGITESANMKLLKGCDSRKSSDHSGYAHQFLILKTSVKFH